MLDKQQKNEQSYKATDYWANEKPETLATELYKKIADYRRFIENTGLLRKYRKSYDVYFGYTSSSFFNSSSDVAAGGEEGELSLLKINHYRSLINHILTIIVASRPALDARATNTDMKSKAQTILANGILEYYMRDKRLERNLKIACEHGLLWGEGFIEMTWNVNLGTVYMKDPLSNKEIHEGDIEYSNPSGPMDVVREIGVHGFDNSDWVIVTRRINRHDLCAQYPTQADAIMGISPSGLDAYYNILPPGVPYDINIIQYFVFYHKKTQSVPQGRMTICASSTIVLFDGPLPYTNLPGGLPIFRIAPAEFFGTSFGYSPAWDIIGINESIDALYSTVLTNQTTFGVQNILVPKGHDLAYQQLTGGSNLLEYDPKLGKPEALNLTHTPPEIFNFTNKLEQVQGLLVGINDVTRGEPQASLKSGSALALVASQAIQFNSGLQASYIALMEDVGTGTIRFLQTYANTKRIAAIAGRRARFMIQEFSGDDLSEINRVTVDVSNPLSRTISGRLEMAKDLMQIPGLIKHADQYLQILETGTFQSMTQGPESELLTIDAENEMLLMGQNPPSLITDDHAMHVREHKAAVSSPDARMDQKVVQAVTQHIQGHIDLLKNADPAVLILTSQQPLPPTPPQAPPGPPPGPLPPSPQQSLSPGPINGPLVNHKIEAHGIQGQANIMNPVNPTQQEADKVHMPKLPKMPHNPMQNQIPSSIPPTGTPGK